MTVIRIKIEPQPAMTDVEVWFCCICGRTASQVTPSGNPFAAVEHFIDGLGWTQLADDRAVCDRCKVLPDVAHILLAQAKARTQ